MVGRESGEHLYPQDLPHLKFTISSMLLEDLSPGNRPTLPPQLLLALRKVGKAKLLSTLSSIVAFDLRIFSVVAGMLLAISK